MDMQEIQNLNVDDATKRKLEDDFIQESGVLCDASDFARKVLEYAITNAQSLTEKHNNIAANPNIISSYVDAMLLFLKDKGLDHFTSENLDS